MKRDILLIFDYGISTMKKLLIIIAGAALVALRMVNVAQAATMTIPVSEDESVVLPCCNQDYNINNSSYRGGLFTGVDGGSSDSPAYFYLKFNLPTYVAETQVTSAILTGYYNDDYNQADDRNHGIYLVPGYADDWWSESTITWYGQPYNYQYDRDFELIANFNAAEATVGTYVNWDITSVVDQEYQGDGVLNLLFRPDDESLVLTNKNWEYFAEKEFDSEKAFRLEINTTRVPEPYSTTGILLFGVLGTVSLLKRNLRNK